VLQNPSELRSFLSDSLATEGFAPAGEESEATGRWGTVGATALAAWAARLAPEADARYGTSAARGAVACALAYADSGEVEPGGEPPAASVGRFARDDSYGELARRLSRVRDALRFRFGWPKAAVRVLVNSGVPEKPLACLAGLGPVGRNSLVLVRVLGPGVVLGALLLPFDPGASEEGVADGAPRVETADFEPGGRCGTCRACVAACPTGAVREAGGIESARCAQAAASSASPVPPEVAAAWPGILYGCDRCLAACPRFVRDAPGWQADSGARATGPGRAVRLEFLERASDLEIRDAFRGTALGLGWMKPALWRRNAALAARRDAAAFDATGPNR
jgi:epoxyqueuosine reductase